MYMAMKRQQIDLTPLVQAKVPIIFVLGGPGSGKGTQCAKILERFRVSHLSTGDLLRETLQSGSPHGQSLQKIMEAGQLVPLEVVLDLVKEAMLKELSKGSKGFLIDGYPRDVKQGQQFENEIQPCSLVLYFELSDELMTERLIERGKTSGRSDDNKDTIRLRLKTFQEQTKPVVDYYATQKKLVSINSKDSIDEVFKQVLPVVRDLLEPR